MSAYIVFDIRCFIGIAKPIDHHHYYTTEHSFEQQQSQREKKNL